MVGIFFVWIHFVGIQHTCLTKTESVLDPKWLWCLQKNKNNASELQI